MASVNDLIETLNLMNKVDEKNYYTVLSKATELLSSGIKDLPTNIRCKIWRKFISLSSDDNNMRKKIDQRFEDICERYESDRDKYIRDIQQIKLDLQRQQVKCLDKNVFLKIKPELEQILYLLSRTLPITGYVQGINDILMPIYVVFLSDSTNKTYNSICEDDLNAIILHNTKVDTFNFIQTLLFKVIQNYVKNQPGLKKIMEYTKKTINRFQPAFYQHVIKASIDLDQTLIRWITCLFSREFNFKSYLLILDSIVTSNDLTKHLSYISSCLFIMMKNQLMQFQFEKASFFLQETPTYDWSQSQIQILLAEVFIMSSMLNESPRQLL